MLQLSKSQYKDLCTECASKMMVGSGADMSFPSTIPDFEGTDISFWVEDPALEGGGFIAILHCTVVPPFFTSESCKQESAG
eukprot:COSAG03_NODE_220_length_10399_cov_58.299806_9_plen_81_part_00